MQPVIAYCGPNKTIQTWDGETTLGRYEIVSRWRVNSWMSDYRYAIRATVNGIQMHGTTFGQGMCVTLRPYKTA